MSKYTYKLNKLDCANCAKRIEDALNKNEKIKKAVVNYSKLSVTIDTDLKEGVLNLANDIIKRVEPDVFASENANIHTSYKFDVIRLVLGIVFIILSMLIKLPIVHEIFIILAYLVLLFRVLKKAVLMLVKNFSIDENLLVSISCIGAYLTNNIHEGLMVIILYEIGKILESMAVNNSRKSISDLMDIKPEYANLKVNDKIKRVDPSEVEIDELIIIKKGEKIPLDGTVVEGVSKLDNKALTGESNLVSVKKGSAILSGGINVGDILTIKVTKTYEDSTVAQILSLVENATDKKAKTENFVSKAAKIYTPIILCLAILIGLCLPLIPGITYEDSIYRALVFLVVSCPCAIAISVPLSYFSGIGASSKKGILIKGSNYLEAMAKIKEIIFDKTGTITNGDASNYDLKVINKNYSEEDVIKYFVSGEVLSNHPIAKSIIKIFPKTKTFKVNDFKEIEGKGITFKVKNEEVLVGSSSLVGINTNDNAIYLKIDNKFIAKLSINDGIKKDAKETINYLNQIGINTQMFTGDKKDIAMEIAKKVGIKDVKYELLPKDKFDLLDKEIKKYDGDVAFVGDGINDAPALRVAKVGISMGSIGSASAIEASDIVLMNDNLSSIIDLFKISKKTNQIIKENLIFAIGIKILILILSGIGLASMWLAVFADTGVTLLTIINTTRILKNN